MSKITVRTATLEDAAAIWEIYRYYVEHTAISFEITVPTAEQLRQRIEKVLAAFPYLVAEADGQVLGYAYAGPFIPREAYSHCAEVSIYISREKRCSGIGRLLYEELTAQLRSQGITQLYACIGVPEKEDEYLNNNSAQFHAHMGFQEVGRFRNSGKKFGRFYHMIWMEKIIADN
jgi:phosphinothricin acetyltransferase